MSADNQETAGFKLDPNYAVICSFMEHFAQLFYQDSVAISIQTLDSFLEAESVTTDNQVVKFHVKLLNGIGNTTKPEQWEKGLIKFSEDFPERDDKLIKKLTYNKIPVAAKLRILKNLCEDQFEYNDKFNVKVNKLEENDLRNVSVGTDRQGRTYWYMMDKKGDIRVYRSFRDDFTCVETWRLLCSDADELKDLIEFLETYGNIEEDPQLPIDRAIPTKKLLFKKEFLEITEENIEDIVADTKNPNQMYYKLPMARTSLQIDKDEKKNKLRHCFIKLAAEDKTPAEDSLEKLLEERKLQEKLAANTEKAAKTEISSEMEKVSETEDAGKTDVGETEDLGEMKDAFKSSKVVGMENGKLDKESKTESTFKAGKTGDTSETEDTVEIEDTSEMTHAEKREEESETEEADSTEKAGEAEECKTEKIGKIEKASKIEDPHETEDASETEEAVKMEKAGKTEKGVEAKEETVREKIEKACKQAEIDACVKVQETKCKESKRTDVICNNGPEIGNSPGLDKDETCIKGKDTALACHKKEKQGICILESKTKTDNLGTKEDKTVLASEEIKQREVVNATEKRGKCASAESVKNKTQGAISIGEKCEQDVLVSKIVEHQDLKDKLCSENGGSSMETNKDGTKSSDVSLDTFEDDQDMKETLMRISELSGAYTGSESRLEIGKESTENNAHDSLKVSDKSSTVMTDSLSMEKRESDKISAIEQHNKENDTKAFDEALEGLKTLEEIISQGNAILASETSMGNKLIKDKSLCDEVSEPLSTTLSSELSKDTCYQDDMANKDKTEKTGQTSDIGKRSLTCDKIDDFQSGKEVEAGDTVSKSLDDMIKSLKTSSSTSVEPEIPIKLEFNHKDFDCNKAKVSELVLDKKQYSKLMLETQQDSLKKELKVELERIDEIFKRRKQDMNDLVKVFNCDGFDFKPRNSPGKRIPVSSVKQEKTSHIPLMQNESESMKSSGGDGSQIVVDKKADMEFYSFIVKEENSVEIVQPTNDSENRNEEKIYKDAFNLKRDTGKKFDDIVEGGKINEKNAAHKINGHKLPVHELKNETVTENEEKSPEVEMVKTDSSVNRIISQRNTAESSFEKSKDKSSEKTVKMVVDGDVIEINELSSSSENEEQGDDMNTYKTVQQKNFGVKTATQAMEDSSNTNIEHAYSSLDKSKRLAKEALQVHRKRIRMGNKIMHGKLPLVTPGVPLRPTNLIPLSTKKSDSASAASQNMFLTSNSTSNNLIPFTSIVPRSTAAPQSTVVIVPQSNVQMVKNSDVSFGPQPNVKIVPQPNIIIVSQSSVVPQSNIVPQSTVLPQSSVLPQLSVVPQPSVVSQSSVVPQSSVLPQSSVVPQLSAVPQQSVVPQSSVLPQSSVVLQSSVRKSAPPAPFCRSLLQNPRKKSAPTLPAVSSSFVPITPSNPSMTLPISISSILSSGGQNLNKAYNSVNQASSREGNLSEKQTGPQFLHQDMGRKIVVGPGLKCYDAQTGVDVNLQLNSNAFPFLRPGSTFILVKKLTSNETVQNKQQNGVPQTTSNLNQSSWGKNIFRHWQEPRTKRVTRARGSFRGRGRGRRVEILDDSSDSEEFIPMDSDDSDYDYDNLSRHIHEAAKTKKKFERRLPKYLQEGYETDTESSKREKRQREVVNYNEDSVEISESDVDVETVEEIKKVEEKAKPKPPEKFEVMEYPCTICGSSDYFATILTCADCDSTYHMACLSPPILALPSEDWFCPQCEHQMLVENLKDKYKELRKLLYSIERKNNKINARMFDINKENIIEVNRSARTRKEVNYDETKFDDMVKSAVKEYNKMEEEKSTKTEEKKSSRTSSAKSNVKDSDESDSLSATESEPTDNTVGGKRENRRNKEASPEPDSHIRSLRKRSAKNQKSAGCEDTGPTKSKVKKLANGEKADVKLKGKNVTKSGEKEKQKRSSRQGKELSEESDDSQKRKLGRKAKNSTDVDSDFALSDTDEAGVDGDSDTEDYEDNTVKKEGQEEHVYYTSSGRKTNSLSKLKNAF